MQSKGWILCIPAAIAALSSASPPRGAAPRQTAWPTVRARHHMVFDAKTQQILLLGGAHPSSATARDTAVWSWNGTVWSTLEEMTQRYNYAAAYDVARGCLTVHGGSGNSGGERDDTWERDAGGWRLVSPAGPGSRAHHAMVYDRARSLTLLFGNSDDAPDNHTWAWDGRVWKRIAADGPPRRGVAGFVFDTRRNVAVLFGGYGRDSASSRNSYLNDTWEWDGARWQHIATPVSPSPRYDVGMAYDSLRGRVILFGGRGPSGNLGDTWEYDGRSWTKVDVTGPSPRNGLAMVFDPRTGAVLLFGGRNEPAYFNDFWTYDGAWKKIEAGP